MLGFYVDGHMYIGYTTTMRFSGYTKPLSESSITGLYHRISIV